jgi:dolichol kinase
LKPRAAVSASQPRLAPSLPANRWSRFIDRWVRPPTRDLDRRSVYHRKVVHILLAGFGWLIALPSPWPFPILVVSAICLLSLRQRCVPWAPLGLLTLLLFAGGTAAAGAWVLFTVGDGLAGLVGTRFGGPKLWWNGRKTWLGTAAFALGGGLALLLFLVTSKAAPSTRLVSASFGVALAGALVECSVDRFFNDNYAVLVTTGTLLYWLL